MSKELLVFFASFTVKMLAPSSTTDQDIAQPTDKKSMLAIRFTNKFLVLRTKRNPIRVKALAYTSDLRQPSLLMTGPKMIAKIPMTIPTRPKMIPACVSVVCCSCVKYRGIIVVSI